MGGEEGGGGGGGALLPGGPPFCLYRAILCALKFAGLVNVRKVVRRDCNMECDLKHGAGYGMAWKFLHRVRISWQRINQHARAIYVY